MSRSLLEKLSQPGLSIWVAAFLYVVIAFGFARGPATAHFQTTPCRRPKMIQFSVTRAAVMMVLSLSAASAQIIDLPEREGARPETTGSVPHIQLGAQPVPELSQELVEHVGRFKGVVLMETRFGFPGSVGFNLGQDLPVVQPDAIVSGREFGHIHPDGSLHVSLNPATVREAVRKGWAIEHPWANSRPGWETFVMIYTPTSREELATVMALLEDSFLYVTGLETVN